MSYCPSCRYEYRPEVTNCPDCNVPLVEAIPASGSAAISPDDSWVVVGKIASQMKSEMAKGSLDSQNIPSVVLSSTLGAHGKGVDFVSRMAVSDTEGNVIMVPREYQEDATIILEAILGDDLIFPDQRV